MWNTKILAPLIIFVRVVFLCSYFDYRSETFKITESIPSDNSQYILAIKRLGVCKNMTN